MSFSASRQGVRRPEPIQTDVSRKRQRLRSPTRNAPTPKITTLSAAERRARARQIARRYSTGGPRSQWPEPEFMRSSDPFRRVRGCVHTSIEVRLPRPPVLGSDGTLVSPPSTPPPLGLSEAEVAAWHRKRQHEEMQGLQLELWKRGLERFGRLDDAHVFVRALPLAGARSPTSSTSEESDVPFSSLSSPTSTVPKRLSLRAIVHSRSNPPFGLKREFDLDALRETIPEPLPKSLPRLFDREKWLSKVQLASGFRRASWPAATPPPLVKTSVADERKTAESVEPNPSVSAQGIQSMVGVPINLEYARTALPALAAIIMSDRVKRGDMIDLALPHPEAWPETVAYVYSGSLGFLSEETKANVIYLGGKPGKKIPRGYGTRSYFACAPYWPPIRRG